MVARVADEHGTVGTDRDAVGPVELGLGGGAAIAGAAAVAVAGDGGDGPGPGVDSTDGVVLGIDDEEVAVASDGQLLRAVEGGLRGGAAVARVTLGAGAGDGPDRAGLRIDGAEGVALPFEDVEGAVRPDLDGPAPKIEAREAGPPSPSCRPRPSPAKVAIRPVARSTTRTR